MENYIGKICPFCKTEIKEGESVKVCPACNIPHHESCWTENNGCTTFCCPEQHYEAQHTNPTDVCKKCGGPLGAGQAFCPKCGQKIGLDIDENTSSAINQFNADVAKTNEAKKKKPMKAAIVAGIAVAVIIIGALLLPKIFVSVEKLCAQGNYVKAYEKASGEEKDSVLAENVIAVLSEKSSDALKDPSSFMLREGYYYCFKKDDGTFGQQAVLYLSGNNSYGAAVSNYWVWVYSIEDEEWEFWGTSDTTETESSDELEDLLVKVILSSVIEEGIPLDKSQVKNINAQFEEDTLYTVELIDKDDIDISRF